MREGRLYFLNIFFEPIQNDVTVTNEWMNDFNTCDDCPVYKRLSKVPSKSLSS